jgi:hypothetical protein
VLTRRVTVLAAGVSLALVLSAVAASAADGGGACPPNQTTCDAWGGTTPQPVGVGDGGGNDGGGSVPCVRDGVPVPCSDPILGWFNPSDGCYYRLSEPQPAGGPAGRSEYVRSCGGGPIPAQDTVWLANPPPGFAARPAPAELAVRALAQIDLVPPIIGIAPDPRSGPGLVGLPIWLWVREVASPTRTRGTWGPLSTSVSERGVTVALTAKVAGVTFAMGDDKTVTCTRRGTDHTTAANPAGRSPTCGYDGYQRSSRGNADGTYQITATTTWNVAWAGGGESGQITGVTRTSDVAIQIDELQVVTR